MNFVKNNLILVIAIILIFSVVRVASGENNSLLSSSKQSDKLPGSNLLSLLLKLKSVKIDGSLFKEKTFTNLKDFSTEIQSQPVGRVNPFNQIGIGDDNFDLKSFSSGQNIGSYDVSTASTSTDGSINLGKAQVSGI